MKNSLLLIVGLALTLLPAVGAEKPVAASREFSASLAIPGTLSIRAVKRSNKEGDGASATIRDPFFPLDNTPPAPDQAAAFAAPVLASAAPALPAFQILGKQEDEVGWAVFISAPDKPGQVWVVREGEAFNENFYVSKLAPPLLIIKNTRSRQSRRFDIGKDEE